MLYTTGCSYHSNLLPQRTLLLPVINLFIKMENTLSIYVESTNETWEMGDDMALKLEDFKRENPGEGENTDDLHLDWYNSLSPEDQSKITKHTPQE